IGGILFIGAITGGFGGQNVLDLIQKAILGFFGLIVGVVYAILHSIFSVVAMFMPQLKPLKPAQTNPDDDNGVPRTKTNHDAATNIYNVGDLQALDWLRIASLVVAAL